MSEFSRWLTRKYPEYLLEQDAPMQQNAPAQSAAEILRQRLQKRAAEQGNVPTQQNQDAAQAAAERLKQRMQQRQGAGGTGANAGGNAGAGASGSVKDFMNDKNLDSRKALTILNTPNLTLTDQEADHLLKAADLYSLSLCDLASDYELVPNFNKTAIKKFIEEKIRKAGGIKNLITSEEEGKYASRRLQSTAFSDRNDFEILLFLNNKFDLKMISPQLASEIIKEYKNKDFYSKTKGNIDPDYILRLEKIAITDKNLASETLKNMNFYDIERMFSGSKYVEICNEKIKSQGGIDNLETDDISLLIQYNIRNNLTGDRAKFISPQDARKILMRSDLTEQGPNKIVTGGIEWLRKRARE
jgi:hypothetical protein